MMAPTAELLQTDPEQLKQQFFEQLNLVNSLRVRGLSHEDEDKEVLNLQEAYGNIRSWDEPMLQHEWDRLSDALIQLPSPDLYHRWVARYVFQARAAHLANDYLAKNTAIHNAELVINTRADQQGWDQAKTHGELDDMIDSVNREPKQQAETAHRSNKVASLLGITAVGGYFARRRQNSEAAPVSEDDTDEEMSNKKKVVIAAAIIGGLVVTAALVDGYLESQGRGLGVRNWFGGNSSRIPSGAGSSQHMHTKSPMGKQSITPSLGDTGNPAHKLRDKLGDGRPGAKKHAKAAAGAVHQQLRYYGDTIFYHMQHALGKDPSATQIDKVLHANHLSANQARHLPVGYKFILPNPK